jgi:pimeloyl-ACP methyl ester carboxylesterase
MSLISVALALMVLAAVTQVGVLLIERAHAPVGQMIDVAGGRLHVVELGERNAAMLPVVLIHGASSNLESMRQPLGDLLARRHRVILIDRPGHGWSTREALSHSTPVMQAHMIDEALGKLGVDRAVIVGHSWGGALAPALAINHPARVAGLVMLAPVTYPWPGGVAWYHNLGALPVVGPLFAYTLALPTGLLMVNAGARGAFLPQTMPANYVSDTRLPLLLRPREFLANAWDMSTLKAAVAVQSSRYAEIKVPVVILHGDADKSVYIDRHSRPFVKAVPQAELIVLPGVGHLVPNAATDRIVAAVERLTPHAAIEAQATATRRSR